MRRKRNSSASVVRYLTASSSGWEGGEGREGTEGGRLSSLLHNTVLKDHFAVHSCVFVCVCVCLCVRACVCVRWCV